MNPPTSTPMPPEPMENESPEATEETPEAMSLDLSALPKGVKVGDSVPMRIDSIDEENGTAQVSCASNNKSKMGGAISKMAASYDTEEGA